MGSLVKISYDSKLHLFVQLRCDFNLLTATVNYTSKHNFCHMKTNLCFLCIFHTEFKYVTRIALPPTVFM